MDNNEHIGLTIDDCLDVLKNAKKNQQYQKGSISFDIKPVSEVPQGGVGEHFIITISYKTEDEDVSSIQFPTAAKHANNATAAEESKQKRFFLKNMSGSSAIVKLLAESLNAYEKEAFFYDIFLKECRMFGIDVSYAPEGYFTRPHFLILEDISPAGYRTPDKIRLLNLGQCRTMLDAVAKFHVSSVVYEYKKRQANASYSFASENKDAVLERVEKNGKINVLERWVQASMDGLVATIDVLSDDDTKSGIDKDVFKRRLRAYVDSDGFYGDLGPKKNDLCCLLHNDLWCNNFMFLHPPAVDGGDARVNATDVADFDPIDCKLIDYQMLSYGSPAVDVMRAIHTNTRQETRDAHRDELLKHYFHRTIECLKHHGLGPENFANWTWDIFSASCDRVDLVMKLRALAARSMTLMPATIPTRMTQEPGGMERLLFTHRDETMQESYTLQTSQGEHYRTVIGEDIREIWKMLAKRSENQIDSKI